MSTRVLLIRHGDNDFVGRTLAGWLPGVHLNRSGRRQAEKLAERLSGAPIRAIYTSPLERTCETAAPLAARLGLELRISEGLGEVRLGEWTGRAIRDLEDDPQWRRFNAARSSTRIPGGELMLEVQARMVEAFEGFRRNHPDSMVAAFSHGDPIRVLLLDALGMPLDYIHRLEISTAGVSVIELNEWGPTVLRVNDTGELP
ncbi:MAG TPA: histidine phosphatase family protein [Bryobacteraceae bacterium]